MVHVLNYGADEVMRLADAGRQHGDISVSTGELTSIVDPKHERKVANDVDEALWEEVETGLRHQSRVTANYLGLMTLGGAVPLLLFIFTCKSGGFESGPDETQTCEICHAKVAL